MPVNFDDPVILNSVCNMLLVTHGGVYARNLVKAIEEKGEWGYYYYGESPNKTTSLFEYPTSEGKQIIRWHNIENGGFLSPFGIYVARKLKALIETKDPLECPAHL